jgi:hypothetical protein
MPIHPSVLRVMIVLSAKENAIAYSIKEHTISQVMGEAVSVMPIWTKPRQSGYF